MTTEPVPAPVSAAEKRRALASLTREGLPAWFIYPFFAVHMGMFGVSGFLMAYGDTDAGLGFLYLHGGFAIFAYLVFYLAIFGLDDIKWMFMNAGLGLFGISAEIDAILNRFGKDFDDFSWAVHAIPFTYYVMYTFLLRQALIDFSGARERPIRRRVVESLYVLLSLLIYGRLHFGAA